MLRRHWLVAVSLLAVGCSSSSSSGKKKSSSSSSSKKRPVRVSTGRKRMNSGPQGFGNVLVPSYIEDLKSGSPEKQIAAAEELGNMGSSAKEALPVLEKLAADKNGKVSAAAKAALGAIKK